MTGDLHIHSYYSDGYLSPADAMQHAKEAGCEVVALTDHDALGGLTEAENAAHSLGMKFIRGVEISAFDRVDTHILGYGIDVENPRFKSFLKKQKERRGERARLMIDKLSKCGIVLPKEVFEFKVEREISRSHIADAIVECGYEPDFNTAFYKWCRYGVPTYVNIGGPLPGEAVEEIHLAGGLAVLAHPMRIAYEGDELLSYIEKIASFGIDGIEAEYRDASENEMRHYVELSKKLGVFYTSGNDFHGLFNKIVPRELYCGKLLSIAR